MGNPRVIAVYLPQFHAIPENDAWWGKGFTEWVNVKKARPVYRGHYQPKLPSELGFYDLTEPQVREQQAQLASEVGIEGFCYWHYWFGNGRRLLERPFSEVVDSGKPDFPFCLAWANHSWSNKTWTAHNGGKSTMLMEQLYPGKEDFQNHFFAVLPAFKDERYILVDGKPIFFIFDPYFEQVQDFMKLWQKLAIENGLKGIHFVAMVLSRPIRVKKSLSERISNLHSLGFDAVNTIGTTKAELSHNPLKIYGQLFLNKLGIKTLVRYRQRDINRNIFSKEDSMENVYPTTIPNWDRTPRCGKSCVIYTDSTPEAYEEQLKKAISLVSNKAPEHQLILVRSWNEWGEGNYLEPDIKYGRGYLDAIKRLLRKEG